MIGVVDYGVGNVQAFVNIYHRLGVKVMRCSSPEHLDAADRIVLPGVGAFDWAMSRLNESGLRDHLDKKVLGDGVPVLGVCVGMQMMAESSEEGRSEGLGWIKGRVVRLGKGRAGSDLRLPHMGWNDVLPRIGERLFFGMGQWRFYFLHSYCFMPDDEGDIAAESDYEGCFVSAVRRNEIFGAQFHPEKSHAWGVALLSNFGSRANAEA